MSSPTPGSSVPPVDKPEEISYKYKIIDGVPVGDYRMVPTAVAVPDARVKCSNCKMVAVHSGLQVTVHSAISNELKHMRVYTCTVCGHLSSKKA